MAHIALIEDDAFVRVMLATSLEKAGHHISAFVDVDDINIIFSTGQPDLVITDICLPSISGLDLVRDIKALHPTQKIIVISGGDRGGNLDIDELLETARQSGADAVFSKPFLRTDFLNYIEQLQQL